MKFLASVLFSFSLLLSNFASINSQISQQPKNFVMLNEPKTYSFAEAQSILSQEGRLIFNDLCSNAESIRIRIEDWTSNQKETLKNMPAAIESTSDCYTTDNNPVMIIDKTISTETVGKDTIIEKETIFLALGVLLEKNSSFYDSGQNYGIAVQCSVSFSILVDSETWEFSNVKVKTFSAKFTYLPNQQTSVRRVEYSVWLDNPYGPISLLSGAENNPASGVMITKSIRVGGIDPKFNTPRFRYSLYYTNGGSDNYESFLDYYLLFNT